MKKLLMIIMFILLWIMLCLVCFRGISIGNLKIKSINDIKGMSENLDQKKNEAIEKTSKLYPSRLSGLKEAISALNVAEDKYNEKTRYNGEEVALNAIQVEKYKIEFLWAKLGNYADKRQVKMQMDVIEAGTDTYNLNFDIIGSYIDVTDFIYDIEKDTDLRFKISDFKLLPDNSTTTTTTISESGSNTNTEKPYSSQISISKSNPSNSKSNSSNTNSNGELKSLFTNNNNSKSGTKNIYSPKRLEASFKVYGVEIEFN